MTTKTHIVLAIIGSLSLIGCGSGSSPDAALLSDPTNLPIGSGSKEDIELDVPPVVAPIVFSGDLLSSERAKYRVTLENFWGVTDFPQEFPEDAHLSLIGGATHNAAVSFWNEGEVASRGIEDMAEAGLIDKLLFDEVAPAIEKDTADSMIAVREYTDPNINGVPGLKVFYIEMNIQWPLVSLVTMLGPSPDWFVGVSGLSMLNDEQWTTQLSVDLPLYDGGSKSDITPIMGGPDIIPPNPISLVAYDPTTGVYLPSDEPQNVARLTFQRIALE